MQGTSPSQKKDKKSKDENRLVKKHAEIKQRIENSYMYFKDNYQRFNDFSEFVCKTNLDESARAALAAQKKPTIEFNSLEAFVSRQRGEFAKQQPSLKVQIEDGVPDSLLTENLEKTREVVEMHMSSIFFDTSDDLLEYDCFSEMLIGGFTAIRLYTEFVNSMSFEQNIKIDKVFDPTLVGFDPLARKSHKGDGAFCWERFPMSEKSYIEQYGKDALDGIGFSGSAEGELCWSYKNMDERIIMISYYYEKRRRKTEIVKLTDGHVIEVKNYDEYLITWREKNPGLPDPEFVNNCKRETFITEIVRYRLNEAKILKEEETDFEIFPLIFGAGNAVNLKQGNTSYQMTRPYVYHAVGIQKLKNYAGQSLGNELENTQQHKIIAAIESVPEEYLDGYDNPQEPGTLFYNYFLDSNDPSVTLPEPREIQRTPIPPEISRTFAMADEMMQAILGSYDAAMGINGNQISGNAIEKGQMTSNTAAMPFRMGYIKMINQAAKGIVQLIPKYYITPRSLPILRKDGSRDIQVVNRKSDNSIFMHYDPNHLKVKVSAGVNFAIQKDVALREIREWMGSSEIFNRFINTKCLSVILDNMDIRGIEDLKIKAKEFEEELKEQEEQAKQTQQMQQQIEMVRLKSQLANEQMDLKIKEKQLNAPSKEEIEAAKLELKASENEQKSANDAAEVAVKKEKVDIEMIQTLNDVRQSDAKIEVEQARIAAENARTAVESEMSVQKHAHETALDVAQLVQGEQQAQQQAEAAQEIENETDDIENNQSE